MVQPTRDTLGLPPGLLARIGGGEAAALAICQLFLEEAPASLASIRRALDAGNPEMLRRAAHTFKGSAGNFDADGIVNAARALEDLGRQGHVEGADRLFELLERETRRFVQTLPRVAGGADSTC